MWVRGETMYGPLNFSKLNSDYGFVNLLWRGAGFQLEDKVSVTSSSVREFLCTATFIFWLGNSQSLCSMRTCLLPKRCTWSNRETSPPSSCQANFLDICVPYSNSRHIGNVKNKANMSIVQRGDFVCQRIEIVSIWRHLPLNSLQNSCFMRAYVTWNLLSRLKLFACGNLLLTSEFDGTTFEPHLSISFPSTVQLETSVGHHTKNNAHDACK
jgi:hypothetical protein